MKTRRAHYISSVKQQRGTKQEKEKGDPKIITAHQNGHIWVFWDTMGIRHDQLTPICTAEGKLITRLRQQRRYLHPDQHRNPHSEKDANSSSSGQTWKLKSGSCIFKRRWNGIIASQKQCAVQIFGYVCRAALLSQAETLSKWLFGRYSHA